MASGLVWREREREPHTPYKYYSQWLVVLGSGFAMGHSSSGPSDDSLTDLGLGWVNLFWVTI